MSTLPALLLTNWTVYSVPAAQVVSDPFRRQAADDKLARGEALRGRYVRASYTGVGNGSAELGGGKDGGALLMSAICGWFQPLRARWALAVTLDATKLLRQHWYIKPRESLLMLKIMRVAAFFFSLACPSALADDNLVRQLNEAISRADGLTVSVEMCSICNNCCGPLGAFDVRKQSAESREMIARNFIILPRSEIEALKSLYEQRRALGGVDLGMLERRNANRNDRCLRCDCCKPDRTFDLDRLLRNPDVGRSRVIERDWVVLPRTTFERAARQAFE